MALSKTTKTAEAYLGQGAGNVNDLELGAALNLVSHYIYMC